MVEVPGIEPGSFGAKTGLLRALCDYRFLSPEVSPHDSSTNSVAKMFSLVVCNTNEVKSPLATLDPRSRAAPGLTASKCLCSEFESLLISVSSYFLHGLLVYEIIPASSARFPCLNIQSRDRSPPRVNMES